MTGSKKQVSVSREASVTEHDASGHDMRPEVCEYLDFPFELKSASQVLDCEGSDCGVFEGLASTFGDRDILNDIIEHGAFAQSLRNIRRVKMLWQHDSSQPIGIWESFQEAERGLLVRGRLILDVRQGFEAWALLKAGAVDALSIGEKFSEILQGLERDILRILTRTLITEPIAEGIRGGIQGDETSAGGLEGLLNKAFGTSGLLFGEDEPERPTITRVDSEIADQAATSLLALGDAGDATGALLAGSLSEGALEAGVETLTQAGASTFATTQITELGIAAGAAAAALQALVAAAGTSGAGGSDGGSGLGGLLDLGITAAGFAFGGPGGGAAASALGPQFTATGREGLLASGSFASGGIVSGPGGSRSDRIPALLSDGEFVVNARAARAHRRLLEAVNKGNRLRGLDVFRDGGLATTGVPGIPPIRRGVTVQPQVAPDVFMRPIVVNINNPTSVPEIQRNMAQIRGSLRQMLDRAQRRGE